MASYKCRQSKLCLFKCKRKMTIHGVPFQPEVYNQMNARFFFNRMYFEIIFCLMVVMTHKTHVFTQVFFFNFESNKLYLKFYSGFKLDLM